MPTVTAGVYLAPPVPGALGPVATPDAAGRVLVDGDAWTVLATAAQIRRALHRPPAAANRAGRRPSRAAAGRLLADRRRPVRLPAGGPMTTMSGTHEFEIVRDEQRKRGWFMSWRCKLSGCDARGNSTTPDREKAIELFDLLAEGHRRTTTEHEER